jgi:16S rRNA (guanine527-N7)-methyltransferase
MADVSEQQEAQLRSYLDEMHRWNRLRNLTTVAFDAAWSRHVEEALHLLDVAAPDPRARVVDVGSGTGSPGLVVAIVRRELAVHLVEADRSKQGFLAHVAGLLRLDNVTVLGCRAEAAGRDPAWRESFDVALSRAAAPAAVLCELALPMLRSGGRLFALVSDARAAAASCAFAAGLCGGGRPRAAAAGVLSITKIAATPQRYPRRAGVPARRPLQGP